MPHELLKKGGDRELILHVGKNIANPTRENSTSGRREGKERGKKGMRILV